WPEPQSRHCGALVQAASPGRAVHGEWTVSTLPRAIAKLHNRAFVRPQIEAAAHRLLRPISRGWYEPPPNPLPGTQTCGDPCAGKIERNEELLAFVFARKNQKIAVGTDTPIAAERQRRTFATQIDQTPVEPVHRRVIASLSEDVILIQRAA